MPRGYGLCSITNFVDAFGLVGILSLSLAVGLLAAWTQLNLAIVVMTRMRTPDHVELQPNALPDDLFQSLTTRSPYEMKL